MADRTQAVRKKRAPSRLVLVSFKRLILQIYTEYTQNNTGKLKNDKQGTYLHRRIKIYVMALIVMKKDDDNRSCVLKVSCHTKFRFSVREAQCILGNVGL